MRTLNSPENLNWRSDGLIPCIVQDWVSGEVLMLAYANKAALDKTLKTGLAHYFSRSKQRLWQKGESSGHIQRVKEIYFDCDKDALLFKVVQEGLACHTGRRTCFFNKLENDGQVSSEDQGLEVPLEKYGILDTLYHILLDRKTANEQKSYSASLFAKGEEGISKKLMEEGLEFCFALKEKDSKGLIHEGADMLYHFLLALASQDIHPDRIYQELERRLGVSGIEEKKNRKNK